MAEGVQDLTSGVITDRHTATDAAIERDKFARQSQWKHTVPLPALRVWDALATNLPGTPASDDLGLVTGTWGTDAPYVGTGDLKAAGSTTRRAAFLVRIPPDYEAAEAVTLRVYASAKTTVADTAMTIDAEAYALDKAGSLRASDLVTTAAQSCNSLTPAAKDFTITPDELEPGDVIEVRLSLIVNDAATGTAVIGAVWQVELLADVR